MEFTAIIGIVASACTTSCMLPQLIKIIKEKKAENISSWMLVVLLLGGLLWVWYGVNKNDLIILVANGLSVLINIALTVFTIKYKK